MNKMKTTLPLALCAGIFLLILFGAGLWTLLSPDPDYLANERRYASHMPRLASSSYASDFEDYLADSLPFREALRRYKIAFSQRILLLSDENGVFLTENGVAKDLSPLNVPLVLQAATTVDSLIERYFAGSERVFLSVIPDKAYFAEGDRPSLDCAALFTLLSSNISSPHTDLFLESALSLDSYYATDIHWKSEAILPVAEQLSKAMRFSLPDSSLLYGETVGDFVGTLAAQTPLSSDKDSLTLVYDSLGVIRSATVYYPDGTVGKVYDEALFSSSDDKYNVFLRGETLQAEQPLANFFIRIESPLSQSDRKLILFRDSFARSLVPYLLFAYSEIVLVDMRAPTAFYGENAALLSSDDSTDILFLVSVHTLNETAIR